MVTGVQTCALPISFILDEKAGNKEGKAKAESLGSWIKGNGGTVERQEFWGRRELAYSIKKNRSGFYVTLWFSLPAAAVTELERELRFDSDVIRSLVTKAYTKAVPGTLHPEEEKPRRTDKKGGAEETIRETTGTTRRPKKAADSSEDISEEERTKQVDAALEELLSEEETTSL
jgi:small subunit ribosomal protein S6